MSSQLPWSAVTISAPPSFAITGKEAPELEVDRLRPRSPTRRGRRCGPTMSPFA
jgi:hypothetical protein